MNREKVTFMQAAKFRIRPLARRIEPTGRELPRKDDWWRITSLSHGALNLVNVRTNHFVKLGVDHVTEFITDPEDGAHGTLVLDSQVILKGSGVYLEPAVRREAALTIHSG